MMTMIGLIPDNITFECSNHYGERIVKTGESGLGNELLRKRLTLLYPGTPWK